MKKIDWDILVHHVTGTSSETEERRLAEWMSQKDENRTFVQRLEEVWATEQKSGHRPDTEQALSRVLSRIHQTVPARQSNVLPYPASRKIMQLVRVSTQSYFLRAAAVLLVVLGAWYMLRIGTTQDRDRTSMVFSSMQSLELPDGTKVTCDIGSSFAYSKKFGDGDMREVFLKGEGYFEVARDERRPFLIHADGGRIEVLGTKFNVRAWEKDQRIVVAVKEGRVSFQSEGNKDPQNIVILGAKNTSNLVRGASPTPPESVDISSIGSWMKKEIYFQNTPLPEVMHQLERWYGVTIESADSALTQSKITVFVENKPLVDNLKLISVTMNVRYEQRGDTVRFLPY